MGPPRGQEAPLRVAVNSQIYPASGTGGIESVLVALISALGQLEDGPEEYILVGHHESADWLKPFMGPNQKLIRGPSPAGRPGSFRRALGPLGRIARKLRESTSPRPASSGGRPYNLRSGNFFEGLGCDVVHFPYQAYFPCAIPTVYNPHDLQHLHFPKFYPASEIERRETLYRAGCRSAHTVVVASQWVKDDIVKQYGVAPEKVQVIPLAPPSQVHPEPTHDAVRKVREKYRLEDPFALYPAMTWEQKNHIRLLEALALLRDRNGLKVRLVCTGHKTSFWPNIERRMEELGLKGQVEFLGIVPSEELRALYRLAQFVVVPILFGAGSAPVGEAFLEGTPVACSTVTSLPEQVGDAALLFDPFSVEAIAEAVGRMATDPGLRDDLIERGFRRLEDFSWERTAKAYRALYRRAAGRELTKEDRWLLSWDWMREPRRLEELKRR